MHLTFSEDREAPPICHVIYLSANSGNERIYNGIIATKKITRTCYYYLGLSQQLRLVRRYCELSPKAPQQRSIVLSRSWK
jgi:hypothetical protein